MGGAPSGFWWVLPSLNSTIEVLELGVSKDSSIFAAVEFVKAKYGRLDVLINNAGIALIPSSLTDFRHSHDTTFSTNITSVGLLTAAFLPLLNAASAPKVINVSSARGSLTRSMAGNLPPTAAVAYSVSKTALNAHTIEFQKTESASEHGRVKFYAASPGHLKTAFNNFQGQKDSLDRAEVVVRLVCEEREGGTFWEFEEGEMRMVPW